MDPCWIPELPGRRSIYRFCCLRLVHVTAAAPGYPMVSGPKQRLCEPAAGLRANARNAAVNVPGGTRNPRGLVRGGKRYDRSHFAGRTDPAERMPFVPNGELRLDLLLSQEPVINGRQYRAGTTAGLRFW